MNEPDPPTVEQFAECLRDRAPRAAADSLDLCAHGESVVALENLLDNLHEDYVLLSESELATATILSRSHGVSPIAVEALRGLHLDDNGRRKSVVLSLEHARSKRQLHELLAQALGFPDFYGHNWDAFWDAIGGLVKMPRTLQLWAWDVLAKRLPEEAAMLLRLLLEAQRDAPHRASEVLLRTTDGARIGVRDEARRLGLRGEADRS